jgi:hypothetical protein
MDTNDEKRRHLDAAFEKIDEVISKELMRLYLSKGENVVYSEDGVPTIDFFAINATRAFCALSFAADASLKSLVKSFKSSEDVDDVAATQRAVAILVSVFVMVGRRGYDDSISPMMDILLSPTIVAGIRAARGDKSAEEKMKDMVKDFTQSMDKLDIN